MLQVRAPFVGRGVSRGTTRANLFFFQGIYFSSIGDIKDLRSDCDTIKVNQFLKYSKPLSSSLLFLTRRQLTVVDFSAANLKSFIKNSCYDFLARPQMPFSRRFRLMENQYFLDGG
jgi:hypothetical protein